MEIKINFTLIIQACNFLVAYIILRKFLLKPVIRVIDQEKTEMNTLITTVDARKVIVMQKESDKKERWLTYQKEFAASAPSFMSEDDSFIFKQIRPDFVPESLSEKDKRIMTESMAHALFQKVAHDN